MSLLTLLACSPEVVLAETDVAVDEPSRPDPTLDADGVGAALAVALSGKIPSFPPLASTFADMMAHGDATCPPDRTGFELLLGDGCHAASGYVYSGVAISSSTWIDDTFIVELGADFVITDAGGAAFELGGTDLATMRLGGDAVVLHEEFGGTFRYPPAPGWLSHGTSAAAWVDATFPKAGGDTFAIQGGYDIGGQPIFFDGFTSDDACATAGTIGLRASTGYWYTVSLDCDGCGEVMWDDSSLGTTCIDMTIPLQRYREDAMLHLSSHPKDPR